MYDLGFDLPSRLILSQPPFLIPNLGNGVVNATVANNAATAPDGTSTASTITATAVTQAIAQSSSFSMPAGVVFAFSCYIKGASGVWALLEFTDNTANGCGAWFDANLGVAGSHTGFGTGSWISSTITPAAQGFFLATTLLKISAANTMFPTVAAVNGDNVTSATISEVLTVWHPTRQPLT